MEVTTKITGSSLTASEFMQLVTELENLIEDSGQTLSTTTLDQISKAASNLAAGGSFYTANAVANTYVLTPVSDQLGITEYENGMKVGFFSGAANTGASTVNINSLGAKAITDRSGNALTAGQIPLGDYVELVFVSSSNHFRIVSSDSDKLDTITSVDSPYSPSKVVKQILADASSGAIVINLYASSNNSGEKIFIKKIDSSANTITINPNGSETIEGESSYIIKSKFESVCLLSDGSNWYIFEKNSRDITFTVDGYDGDAISDNSETFLGGGTVLSDSIGGFVSGITTIIRASASYYEIDEDADYNICIQLVTSTQAWTVGDRIDAFVYKDATQIIRHIMEFEASNTSTASISTSKTVPLSKGDKIFWGFYHNTGIVSFPLEVSGSNTFISITKV